MRLMASSLSVVSLSLLRMRDFQLWVAARNLCPRRHLSCRGRESGECLDALHQCRDGAPLGGVPLRKFVTTDAFLMGWWAVFQGRSVNDRWMPQLHEFHINLLELIGSVLQLWKACITGVGRIIPIVRYRAIV